jgi:hypothetical protein
MIEALETLLKDLMTNFNQFGITDASGQKFQPQPFDPSALKEFPLAEFGLDKLEDSHLAFYDPEHCDGIKNMTAGKRAAIDEKRVNANQHEYRNNVGRALWNTALRAHMLNKNPKSSIPGIVGHIGFVDSNNKYLDDVRVENKGPRAVGVKPSILSRAPHIVDERTLAFGKSYQKFIDAMAKNPDPLADAKYNAGWLFTSKIEEGTPNAIAGFITTQSVLSDRIALYEARLNENISEEKRQQTGDKVKKLKKLAIETRDRYMDYFNLPKEIEHELKAHPERKFSEDFMLEKIAALNLLTSKNITTDTIDLDIDRLTRERENLPKQPMYASLSNFQDFIYESDRPINDAFMRMDTDIEKEYDFSIKRLQDSKSKIQQAQQALNATKQKLENLLKVMPEIRNLFGQTQQQAEKILALPASDSADPMATSEELQKRQRAILQNIQELETLRTSLAEENARHLETPKFSDQQTQQDFETIAKDSLNVMTKKLTTRIKQYRTQNVAIAEQIRKKELASAQGSTEGLVNLKTTADSYSGIYSNSLRNTKHKLTLEKRTLEIAQESLDSINGKVAPRMATIQSAIDSTQQKIQALGLQSPPRIITDIRDLITLQKQLSEAITTLEGATLPLSNELFATLQNTLNWDEETTQQWQYITPSHYGYTNWAYTWIASSTVSESPEVTLKKAAQERLMAVEAAIHAITPLSLTLDQQQARRVRLQAAAQSRMAPHLAMKANAEEEIRSLETEATDLQKIIQLHAKDSASASGAFDKQIRDCVTELGNINTDQDNINSLAKIKALGAEGGQLDLVKKKFDNLIKIGAATFNPKRATTKAFSDLYAEKTAALTRQEVAITAKEAADLLAQDQAREQAAAQRTENTKARLEFYEKYAGKQNPDFAGSKIAAGLIKKYLDSRAKEYEWFDRVQNITSFFRGHSWKPDHEARKIYLDEIKDLLHQYHMEGKPQHLLIARRKIKEVLDNPKQFPARNNDTLSEKYKGSMRFLLDRLMTDIDETLGIKPSAAPNQQPAEESHQGLQPK